jgi:hypothetical protein
MLSLAQPARGLDPDVFESMPLRLKIQLAKLSEEQRVRAVQWHSDEALTTASKTSAVATGSTMNSVNTRRSSTGTTSPKAALRNSSGSHSDTSPNSAHGTSASSSTAAASSAHYTTEGGHTADNHSRHNGKHI